MNKSTITVPMDHDLKCPVCASYLEIRTIVVVEAQNAQIGSGDGLGRHEVQNFLTGKTKRISISHQCKIEQND